MTREEIQTIVNRQRKFFAKGKTLDPQYRMEALKRLRRVIEAHLDEIHEAVRLDLGKSTMESYMCETGMVLSELDYMIKHGQRFARKRLVNTPLAQFAAVSFRIPSPYGVVLVMSPWNYPFMLTLDPMVDAIAAGNTVVLKPSNYSPNTSSIICKIISKCFPPEYVAVVTGGREENACLLEEKFDYIFFTGSPNVGHLVMEKAAKNLTPMTLEMGGKSPCIVDKTANIPLAAKRIVFGKFLNCGQTCVAPDYVYCHKSIREQLVQEIRKQIMRQYGMRPLENPDYGRIISKKHFDRICGLLDQEKIAFGGNTEPEKLRIEPTVMDGVTFADAVMGEEIFGPVLPVLTFDTIAEAVAKVNSMPHPLALYYFTGRKKYADYVMKHCQFGGGCVNDTIIHLATTEMGFGGVGNSGMGAYHGKTGFDTFTHYKSMVDKKTWMDLPIRYQPYEDWKEMLVKIFM